MQNYETIDLTKHAKRTLALSLQEVKKPLRYRGLSLQILANLLESHEVELYEFMLDNNLIKKELGLRPSELIKLTKAKPNSIFKALARLEKAKLVEKKNDKWLATLEGNKYFEAFLSSIFQKLSSLEFEQYEAIFLRKFIKKLLARGKDFKLVALVKKDNGIVRPSSYDLALKLGFEPDNQNCLLVQNLIYELENKGLLEVEEYKEGIIIKASQKLLEVVFNNKKNKVQGLKEVNELNDIVKRVRRHKGKIYSYTYLRTFKIKNRAYLNSSLASLYVSSLRKKFRKRNFALFKNKVNGKIVYEYADFRKHFKVYFEPKINGFHVYLPEQAKLTKLMLFTLRTILTKLKLLEKPKYERLA